MIWNLLYGLSPLLAVGLILIVVVTVGLLVRLLIGRVFSLKERLVHNELLGHVAGIAGVINAVLLAFIVFAAWTDYDRARDVVSQEVSLVNDIWRDVEAVSSVHDSVVRELQGYLLTVIDTEWPYMRRGASSETQGADCHRLGSRSHRRTRQHRLLRALRFRVAQIAYGERGAGRVVLRPGVLPDHRPPVALSWREPDRGGSILHRVEQHASTGKQGSGREGGAVDAAAEAGELPRAPGSPHYTTMKFAIIPASSWASWWQCMM